MHARIRTLPALAATLLLLRAIENQVVGASSPVVALRFGFPHEAARRIVRAARIRAALLCRRFTSCGNNMRLGCRMFWSGHSDTDRSDPFLLWEAGVWSRFWWWTVKTYAGMHATGGSRVPG